MAEISIIIPVYNAAAYLPRCLDSVAAQTFGDFEALIIDDGSTDCSADICGRYASRDGRFRIISCARRGVGAARNEGLENAAGRYVMFCDSDDYTAPDWAESLLDAARLHPSSLVGCEFAEAASDGTVNVVSLPGSTHSVVIDKSHYYLAAAHGAALHLWTRIFDMRIIKDAGLKFRTDMHSGEDIVFIAGYLGYCDSLYYLKKCLYFWADNGSGSLSRSYHAHCFEDVRAIFEAKKPLIADIYKDAFYADAYSRFMKCISIVNDPRNKESDEEKERYCQKIISDPAFIETLGGGHAPAGRNAAGTRENAL